MNNDLINFCKELLTAQSPSGFEAEIQTCFRNFAEKYADEVSTDVHGNVIALKKGKGNKKIMLMGHADEIGLMVNYIDDNGFAFVNAIGGVDANLLPGKKVNIHHNGNVTVGVVGRMPIHLLSPEERDKPIKLENLWIDIGVKNKEEALTKMAVGDYITFQPSIDFLPNNLVASKSNDDRIGLLVAAGVLYQLQKEKIEADLYIVSSVQEEIGLRGAKTASYSVNPDVGIAIDVTHATDYPFIRKEKEGDIKLNQGACITIGANVNPKVNELLFSAADKIKEQYQREAIPRATGTDANSIQITRSGIATGLISIPTRYMHTPSEIISLKDVESGINILSEFCRMVNNDSSFIPF